MLLYIIVYTEIKSFVIIVVLRFIVQVLAIMVIVIKEVKNLGENWQNQKMEIWLRPKKLLKNFL